jgi:preprotein translocase subunit SecB
MKISPLQLQQYFVTEFHFTLNSSYKVDQGLQLIVEELLTTTDCKMVAGNSRYWVVTLELKYQPAADTNTPYIFSLGLVGMFEIAAQFDEAKIDRLIRTNGPSVLFGIAREIVREQTARGPDGPFILPSASFLPEESADPAAQPALAPPTQPV